jgi:hypothetical protein
MRYETVRVTVDSNSITEGDPWKAIQPVWWSANIYDGPDEYDHSFRQFSRSQRFVFAVLWYQSQVNNGGHKQFYSNSTGIVWKDALAAFEALGAPEYANILQQSAERLGGVPSLERHERKLQLEEFEPHFTRVILPSFK